MVSVSLTAIRPRKSPVLGADVFLAALEAGLNDTATEVIADYDKTVSTWERKPEFKLLDKTRQIGRRFTEVVVGTDDPIYGYVNDGTPPHVIRPRNARVLAFAPGSRPKTQPNRLLASAGAPGSGSAFAHEVQHPGTNARHFDRLIARKHQQRQTLARHVQARLDAAAKGVR